MEQALATVTSLGVRAYDPGDGFDEAFCGPGDARPHYERVLETLAGRDLRALSSVVADGVDELGMAFRTGAAPVPFPLDPVPRIVPGHEWDRLADGLAQRARALDAFMADVNGERRIVADGRVPERIVASAGLTEPDMRGVEVPGGVHCGVSGSDIVRDGTGELRVLEDNLRTPSGSAYAVGARQVLDEALGIEAAGRRSRPRLADLLGDTLRAAAPGGDGDPSIVLLTDGAGNSAWWEHQQLSRLLGIPLITPRQLDVRGGRVRVHLGEGTPSRPVDVIYRRTDEDRLRDESGALTWLGEALLEPLRGGAVACVNAFGNGVGDDKLVHAYVEEMTRYYLGEEPLVHSVPTYDPGEPSVRAAILDRIDELVVKPRTGFGGVGVIVCPHASATDRGRAARLIRTRPEAFVAQETIAISTHPTVVDGFLEPRHVDLRTFAFSTPDGASVLPGGLTRVALDAGALVVNSSRNGGGKDTWVLH
jgi:uncharacterized circularly permuted ATP-grasp superfamily protein